MNRLLRQHRMLTKKWVTVFKHVPRLTAVTTLKGKTLLITGASRGIGLAMATRAA